jgi:hypothetical protein
MSRNPTPCPRARLRKTTPLVAVVLAATLTWPLTGPAHAERYVQADAKGDVVSVEFESEAQTPAPDNANADVTKTKINHTRGAVRFRVKLRDLAGPVLTGVVADIKTNKRRYSLSFFRSGKRTTLELARPTGEPIKCRGKKRSANVDTDVVKFSVPRSCLGRPKWVRVGVGALEVQENVVYADDALRAGNLKANGSLTFTARLKRG